MRAARHLPAAFVSTCLLATAALAIPSGCRHYYEAGAADVRAALWSGIDPSGSIPALRDDRTRVRIRVDRDHMVTPHWRPDVPAHLANLGPIRLDDVDEAAYSAYIEHITFEESPGRGLRTAGYSMAGASSASLTAAVPVLVHSLRCLDRVRGDTGIGAVATALACGIQAVFATCATVVLSAVGVVGLSLIAAGHERDTIRESYLP